jgi:ABC-2 type transport system ATP-binding protein
MIKAVKLTKRFASFTAISDVSFEVGRGEIVGFLGPNGAGKSTTMRILSGVFPPTSGQAIVAGHDVALEPLRARASVGYFPERVALYLDMTVREYLGYVAQMKGLAAAEQPRLVDEAMESCGVAHVAHRLIGNLSKGYRQRAGIAQALVGRPPVLILDEPTSGLDPEQVAEVRRLIRDLRGRSTVILSTHILPEVEATCDRVIIINKGRVLAVDTPVKLNQRIRRTAQIHLEVVAPAASAAERLEKIPGVLAVEISPASVGRTAVLTVTAGKEHDIRADLAACVVGAGWELEELRPVTLSLEDIFLNLVADSDASGKPVPDEVSSRLPA